MEFIGVHNFWVVGKGLVLVICLFGHDEDSCDDSQRFGKGLGRWE